MRAKAFIGTLGGIRTVVGNSSSRFLSRGAMVSRIDLLLSISLLSRDNEAARLSGFFLREFQIHKTVLWVTPEAKMKAPCCGAGAGRSYELTGVFDTAHFANDGDLYFTGVFEFLLDLHGDIAGEGMCLEVSNCGRGDKYANFTAGLEGICFFHAWSRRGDPFKVLKFFNVIFY